jgi:hypothetical protein
MPGFVKNKKKKKCKNIVNLKEGLYINKCISYPLEFSPVPQTSSIICEIDCQQSYPNPYCQIQFTLKTIYKLRTHIFGISKRMNTTRTNPSTFKQMIPKTNLYNNYSSMFTVLFVSYSKFRIIYFLFYTFLYKDSY